MTTDPKLCTECLGVHPDGQCLATTSWERLGDERDGEPQGRAPSGEKIDAAAATIRKLLEENEAKLQLLERGIEQARGKVRELTTARAEVRRALKSLSLALDVLVDAAALAVPKTTRRKQARSSGAPN